MPETPKADELGNAHTSAADHYRTANMHRASALASLLDASKATDPDDPTPAADLRMQLDKFDRHARLAELHIGLAQARIGATQLLMQVDDDRRTPAQLQAVEDELAAWAKTLRG